MSQFRSITCRRLAATLAVLALLMQAGLTALHGTAMVAHAAGEGSEQAGMMCHSDTTLGGAGETSGGSDGDRSKNILQSCSCCLGQVASAVALSDTDIAIIVAAQDLDLASMIGIAGGRQPLSAKGRGPPKLV